MKRIAFCVILLLSGSAVFAQWSENGKPIPDEPWRKSTGNFGAMLLLSDKPQQFMEDWGKPETPYISTTERADRGEPIVAFVVFLGCKERAGSCNSMVDFTVLRPDGTEYGGEKGVELWKNKPAPPVNVMQLSVANLGIVIEPSDPAGKYAVKARVFDLNAAQGVELVQEFLVQTPPQPSSWSFPEVVESARKVAPRNVEGREFNQFGLAYSMKELNDVPMATMSPEDLQNFADVVTHAYPDAVFRQIATECDKTPVEQLNSTGVAGIAYVSLHAIEPSTRAAAARCLSSIQERLRAPK